MRLGGGSRITLQAPELYGSMGCLVRLGATPMILTAGHVLSRYGAYSQGDDVGPGLGPFHTIAVVEDVCLPSDGAALDAALARVTDTAAVTAEIGDWGPPSRQVAAVAVGQAAYMWGAVSQDLGGKIQATGRTLTLDYGTGPVSVSGLVQWSRRSMDGDSGAVVVDDQMRVVGLHIASYAGSSYFCPVATILQQWPGLTIVGSDDDL